MSWEDNTENEYLAGQVAPAGHYLRIDAPWAKPIILTSADRLPASLNSRVAAYFPLPTFPTGSALQALLKDKPAR